MGGEETAAVARVEAETEEGVRVEGVRVEAETEEGVARVEAVKEVVARVEAETEEGVKGAGAMVEAVKEVVAREADVG